MEPTMQSPLFYIFKVLKHKRKIQSNHNRKFRCPFSFCAKGYNHKNKMLAHLRTYVPIIIPNISSTVLNLLRVPTALNPSTKKAT